VLLRQVSAEPKCKGDLTRSDVLKRDAEGPHRFLSGKTCPHAVFKVGISRPESQRGLPARGGTSRNRCQSNVMHDLLQAPCPTQHLLFLRWRRPPPAQCSSWAPHRRDHLRRLSSDCDEHIDGLQSALAIPHITEHGRVT
jgi:hypothetical protein